MQEHFHSTSLQYEKEIKNKIKRVGVTEIDKKENTGTPN